jgi:hypothetical protein
LWGAPFEAGSVLHASFGASDQVILTGHADGTARSRLMQPAGEERALKVGAPVARVWLRGDYLTMWTKAENRGWERITVSPEGEQLGPFPGFYLMPPVRPGPRWVVLPDSIEDLRRAPSMARDAAKDVDPGERALREQDVYQRHVLAGRHLAVTTDGTLAVTGWGRTTTIWEVWTRQRLAELSSHEVDVSAAAFSRDGELLARSCRRVRTGRSSRRPPP